MNVITSTNDDHIAASATLNAQYVLTKVKNERTPVARFVGNADIAFPPAPAWYIPQTGDIYIHADEAGIDTNQIAEEGLVDFNGAKALGLLTHEAAHAAISEAMTPVKEAAPRHDGLLTTLEEVRVENFGIRRMPAVRPYLRASFTIILDGIRDLDTSQKPTVARAWALVAGRTLAGIATAEETKVLDEAARVLLTDDTVDALTDLLQEALTVNLTTRQGVRRMIEICDEWVDLVGEETSEGDDDCAAEDADGTGAKGKGKPGGTSKAEGGGKGDDTEGDDSEEGDEESGGGGGDEDTEDTEGDDEGDEGSDGGDEGEGDEDGDDWDSGTPNSVKSEYGEYDTEKEGKELADAALKQLAEKLAAEWNEPESKDKRTNSREAAARVFGNKRVSKRLAFSDPSTRHRQAVLEVANVLSELALPAVSKVTVASQLPPGRLKTREAVRASAERAQGRMITAQPWKATKRRHSTARPLIVGIATDTSGSMKWAQRAVADFAYVWANAGHRIGARTAAVTFGDRVYPIARPGIILNHVVMKAAEDSTEECDFALAALDGVLQLRQPSYAARILVVVSDACLVKSGEQDKVTRWLEDFTKAGTFVLWVGSSAANWSTEWIHEIERKTPNMLYVHPPKASPRSTVGFDAINQAVLATVKTHIR